jgi:ABC-type transport system involved in multi-copper enzyme maturation permease subunit
MLNVTWIQHRTAIIAVSALGIAIAIILLITGQGEHAALSSYIQAGCTSAHPFDVTKCVAAEEALSGDNYGLNVVLMAMGVFPVLIGMFIGAPLLSREFESGTFRFVWTQGMGRVRLLSSKLLLLGTVIILVTAVLGLLISWWCTPFNAIGLSSHWQRGQFDISAITLPAWTLLSLALGVCVGTLTRRVLAAMAIGAALTAGLILSVFVWLDLRLLDLGARVSQVTASQTSRPQYGAIHQYASPNEAGPKGSWLVNGWLTNASGHRLSIAQSNAIVNHAYSLDKSPYKNGVMVWLTQHHFQDWVRYQPASRYWIIQAIEGGGLLLLSLLMGVVAVLAAKRMTPSYVVKFKGYLTRLLHH